MLKLELELKRIDSAERLASPVMYHTIEWVSVTYGITTSPRLFLIRLLLPP
jgi:hypothetical protein